MHVLFDVQCHRSSGNLHIGLSGVFNDACAETLVQVLRLQGHGAGRVFVNTADLRQIRPGAAERFKTRMQWEGLPRDWLYFKGEKGLHMAPNGSRVILGQKRVPGKRCGCKAIQAQSRPCGSGTPTPHTVTRRA